MLERSSNLARSTVFALVFCFILAGSSLTEDRNKLLSGWLIPEIADLPFSNGILDASLMKKYDKKKLAVSLIERKRAFEKRWVKDDHAEQEAPFLDVMTDVEILSFMPAKYIKPLLKQGQLNLHQVGHTQGGHEPWWRAELEDLMLGIHLEPTYSKSKSAPVHFLRPKYGLVNFLKPPGVMIDPTTTIGSKQTWLSYGDVIVVYKNDVKLRTTYMYGDSLEALATVPRQIGIPDFCKPAPLIDLSRPKGPKRDIVYVEAQIWGPIDLSDVQEFRIPPNRPDLIAELKNCGVPVFTYDREKFEHVKYPHEPYEMGMDRQDKVLPEQR